LAGLEDGTLSGSLKSSFVGLSPRSLVVLDADHDGRPDVGVVNAVSNNLFVLRGHGDGTFGRLPIPFPSVASILDDFDGDGRTDLASINFYSQGIVALGKADGTFDSLLPFGGYFPGAVFLASGDFDGDGRRDLAIAATGGGYQSGGGVVVVMGRGD